MTPSPRSVRGPIIVGVVMAVALGTAVAGMLWMKSVRPVPGAFVDVLATTDGVIAVRKEKNGPNYFVERWADGAMRWRGLVPPYDGAPGRIGVRVTADIVAVRVRRGGEPAEFVFERERGVKIDTRHPTQAEADAEYPVRGYSLPRGAIAPQPYHATADVLWIVAPNAVIGLELPGLRPVATLR